MNVSTYTQIRTTLRLDKIEEFVATNEVGSEFFVNTITYSGEGRVWLAGAAKNKDGQHGYINRYGSMPVADLRKHSPRMWLSLVESYLAAIAALREEAGQ